MQRQRTNWAWFGWFSLAIALLTLPPLQTVTAQKPAQSGPTDRVELEAFFDQQMASQLKDFHIPGAMVAVVQNGEALLAKGYGYADMERQTPVAADKTLFRISTAPPCDISEK